MRVKRLVNISEEVLTVDHPNKISSNVPPHGILENIQVLNLNELKGKVTVTFDLGEVNENQGKKRLLG